jgi:hypothetical protein
MLNEISPTREDITKFYAISLSELRERFWLNLASKFWTGFAGVLSVVEGEKILPEADRHGDWRNSCVRYKLVGSSLIRKPKRVKRISAENEEVAESKGS